ncbi:ATP-dependent DNA helicase RecG [Sunxiuqinia elliptica]|uniref:ATP-dependent DNA helicase RecG n=1 Tax=Sunxiuqinia elliptica TaxID=655355 RepID=A0A4R6GYE3_9BACT|nr:ATP-dependent DNA helicase RecG [Sunxiuqinia elliptica]TDN99864.1 ATP-dependent DNA helicase RecG [Sunxiuqinia elliptica]TDO57056.1 ATP-dependent DNA helicase RecG [Sunxiuqinia elliptica]
MPEYLDQDIKFLAGVGPKRAELLKKELGIRTFRDLLYYFPYKYIDRTKFHAIAEVRSNQTYIQAKGKIRAFEVVGERQKQRLTAVFYDETGSMDLVWFQGIKYIRENLVPGKTYVVFGKPSVFNGRVNIIHPEVEDKASEQFKTGVLQAFYNTTEKLKKRFLNTRAINKIQYNLAQQLQGKIYETLPSKIKEPLKLISLKDALRQIHFPESTHYLQKATFRLKFEELFYIQLKILSLKHSRLEAFKGFIFSHVGYNFNQFYANNLPFELTGAQKKVIKEIRKDLGSGKQMNRLLQGDVGSGKTLVALMTALLAFDNGFQASLMAPTEILAIQHYNTIVKMLTGLGVKVALLTGSTKKAERKKIHEQLESGELQLLIGTHALIEDTVSFSRLGLVIIDEQHRFGVAQRAKLWKKNKLIPPHILVMTATPIPRTLAMTLYGDLDVSVIDELPPGRKPIDTRHYFENRRKQVYEFIRGQIEVGRQAYIVYPLISESEKMDYKNLEDGYELMKQVFPRYQLSMVHGKMKPAEKDAEMQLFKEGKTQIMVATTVIEVGVDVPNASIMVIESSERFGLSQLHQLRGRVGRGAEQSYCLLMSSYKISNESRKRLETMVRTNDGFEIAEVDLQLRGPGDIEGTQQSGLGVNLNIANLGKDGEILRIARNVASDILSDDPRLEKDENKLLLYHYQKMKNTEFNWSVIS